MEQASFKLFYPQHLKFRFEAYNLLFPAGDYKVPLKVFYYSTFLNEHTEVDIMPRITYEEKILKLDECFGEEMKIDKFDEHVRNHYMEKKRRLEYLSKSACFVNLEHEQKQKFLKLIYKCNNNLYEFHRPISPPLTMWPFLMIFQVKCDCNKHMHDYDCREGLTCFHSYAEVIYSKTWVFKLQQIFHVEKITDVYRRNPPPKFKIIVEDWTDKYDEARSVDKGHKMKKYLKIDFCTLYNTAILFSKILKLEETKQNNVKWKHYFLAERNDCIKYLGEKFRVVSVDFHFVNDINTVCTIIDNEEPEIIKEHKNDRAEALWNTSKSSFRKQRAKVKLPCLYFIYDLETQINSKGEHYCYMACCEYFLDFPRPNERNDYGVPRMFKEFENIININDDKILIATEAKVMTKLLNYCVDVMDRVCRFHRFQITDYDNYELKYMDKFKDIRLNVRFIGYNNSKYDDKFLTRNDYFNKAFNYHIERFTERQSIPSEHEITNCHALPEFIRKHVSIKFHDCIRFCPEVGSLKNACEGMNIELPKIDFEIVNFNRMSRNQEIKNEYDLKEFFEVFFKKKKKNNTFLEGKELWDSIFMTEGARKIECPATITKDILFDIVLYYCERDVIATRLLYKAIEGAWIPLISKIMTTKRPDGVSTYYDQFHLPYVTKHYKKPTFYPDGEGPNGQDVTVKSWFPVEETHLCDPYERLSLAQMSMTIMKAAFLGNCQKLSDRCPRTADIIRTHIRPTYFGGFTNFNIVGLYRNVQIGYYDIKSSYPLGMTGVMPILSDEIGVKYDLSEDDYLLLESKIKKAENEWELARANKTLHTYHVFSYINFHAFLLVDLEPPKDPRKALGISPVHFPESLGPEVRQLRYFNVPVRIQRNAVQIGSAILLGWKVKLCRHNNDIVFNCLRKRNQKKEDPYRCQYPLRQNLINATCDDWEDVENEKCRVFNPIVKLLGDFKADAATEGNVVMKKMAKMLLNASAGRLGMREKAKYTETIKIFNGETIIQKNEKSWKSDLSQNVIEIASIIVAYGHYNLIRSVLLVELANLYNDKPFWENAPINLYNDTDSIIVDESKLLPEVKHWIESNESKEIGCWDGKNDFNVTWGIKTKKESKKANALFVLAKKSYLVLNEDENGNFKNVMIHSKGINVVEFTKYFLKEDGFVDVEKIHSFIKEGSHLFKYDYIKKSIEKQDYIQKTFTNTTQEKLISLAELGVHKEEFMSQNSFLPKIAVSEYLSFTHHPCCYTECQYCNQWYFRNRQQLAGACKLNLDLVNGGFKQF